MSVIFYVNFRQERLNRTNYFGGTLPNYRMKRTASLPNTATKTVSDVFHVLYKKFRIKVQFVYLQSTYFYLHLSFFPSNHGDKTMTSK